MVIKQAEHKLRPLSELRLWDKNPRRGTREQMDNLRKKIERNGLYKALITTPDGLVVGGNMRFRVLKEMGVTGVWCSVFMPRDDAHMIEVAISDNESDGEWVEEELAELVHNQPIELDLYAVHLFKPISLANMLEPEDTRKEVSFKAKDGTKELSCPECGHVNVPSAFKTVEQ